MHFSLQVNSKRPPSTRIDNHDSVSLSLALSRWLISATSNAAGSNKPLVHSLTSSCAGWAGSARFEEFLVALGCVVVHLDVPVIHEARERLPMVQRVANGLRHGRLGPEIRCAMLKHFMPFLFKQ